MVVSIFTSFCFSIDSNFVSSNAIGVVFNTAVQIFVLLICFCFISFDCCSVSIDSIFVSFDCCAVCFDGSILCFVFVVLSVQLLLNFCSVAVDFSVQLLISINASCCFVLDSNFVFIDVSGIVFNTAVQIFMLLICFCFVCFDCISVSFDCVFVSSDSLAVCFDGFILCFVFVVLSVQLLLNFCSVAVDFSVQLLVSIFASCCFCFVSIYASLGFVFDLTFVDSDLILEFLVCMVTIFFLLSDCSFVRLNCCSVFCYSGLVSFLIDFVL